MQWRRVFIATELLFRPSSRKNEVDIQYSFHTNRTEDEKRGGRNDENIGSASVTNCNLTHLSGDIRCAQSIGCDAPLDMRLAPSPSAIVSRRIFASRHGGEHCKSNARRK